MLNTTDTTDTDSSLDVEGELLTLEGLIEALHMVRYSEHLMEGQPAAHHLSALYALCDAAHDQMGKVNEALAGEAEQRARAAGVPAEGEAPRVVVTGRNAERLARLARRWALPSSIALSHALEKLEEEYGTGAEEGGATVETAP